MYNALDRFDVILAPGAPARLMSIEGRAERATGWFIKSLTPDHGYGAALAVNESDFRLSYRRFPEKLLILNKINLLTC